MTERLSPLIMERIRKGHCEILGFGVSGKPLLPWLVAHGARHITVRDKRALPDMEASGDAEVIRSLGAQLVCGEGYLEGITSQNTVILRSPGIRPDLPEIAAAVADGALLSSEMELFLALTPAYVIGITGSDGKTTTTTLIAKMLEGQTRKKGKGRVYLGGNIGTPLLPLVDGMTADDFAVVELSSFQLMTLGAEQGLRAAVITNITPNHLNWHTDMEEYVAAKAHLCAGKYLERAVLNLGNDHTRSIGARLPIPVTWFSVTDRTDIPRCAQGDSRVYVRDGMIMLADAADEHPLIEANRILLPGRHNVENYMAAMSALWGLVDTDVMAQVAETFGGVPHRLELVREKDGVKFYNGSIDSSPSRTCAALSALRELRERQGRHADGSLQGKDPIVICGGQDKHVPFAPLARGLCAMASAVVLTGEARDQIMTALEQCPDYDPQRLKVTVIPDYLTAMEAACRMAQAGDIVLLSPACTSFDAFKNFEARGEAFRSIVRAL